MAQQRTVPKAYGTVAGPHSTDILICQYANTIRPINGILTGDNIFQYAVPVAFAQITMIFLTTRLVHFLLKPFRQSMSSAQILAGIVLGPSFMWHYWPAMLSVFPAEGRVILHTLGYLGIILHLFLQTLKIDARLITRAGSKAVLIGVTSMVIPIVVGGVTCEAMINVKKLNQDLISSIPRLVVACSLSTCPVISNVLFDLKLLNSELGRLATKTSIICDLCGFIIFQLLFFSLMHRSFRTSLEILSSFVALVVAILFVLKPLIIRMTRCIKKGEEMDETHFFFIVVAVLQSALISEILGMHYTFGPALLGLVLPDGPPLGTELEQKLELFANGLLLPVFSAISGLNMNIFAFTGKFQGVIESVIIITFLAKFIGTTVPALCCGMPFLDAFCLTLILCCKGIIEIALICNWKDSKLIDDESFGILLISMLIVTGLARPLVSYLYDPSKRYKTKNRRSILDSSYDCQLRMLVCLHDADDISMIMKILEACNPTRYSPLTIYVLHLMKLTGRAVAVLVPHHPSENLTHGHGSFSTQTVNVFNRFEQRCHGAAVVQHFTAIAPYKSMHSDICTVALDKRTTIVIIPFHKQWSIDGKIGSINPSIRFFNQNVMDNAPCTVGLLIDRGTAGRKSSVVEEHSTYNISLLLFGGDDDREALAFSCRLAEHPSMRLLIVLVKHGYFDHEKEMDIKVMINRLCHKSNNKGTGNKITVEEVVLSNGEDITRLIRSFGDGVDLVIVGRHHDPTSPITSGLIEWSECPEIGVFGDMLATSDFGFSVMVIVQQPLQEIENTSFLPFSTNTSFSSRTDEDMKALNKHSLSDLNFPPK